MSCTEIYGFDKEGNAYLYAQVKNAWRGGMAIWKIMDERHLPPYRPPDVPKDIPDDEVESYCHYKPSRLVGSWAGNDKKAAQDIWDLAENENIPEHERIVMSTTFDKAVVKKEDIPKIIEAFNAFEGETSLKDQAKVLQTMFDDDKCIAVAWNQTSVSGDGAWDCMGEYDEEIEGGIPYNLNTGDEHWYLFEDED
jgi:hypothetical protein